jgi:hypothetical protein
MPKGRKKILTVEIDADLYARMEAKCKVSDLTIDGVVERLIRKRFPYTSAQRKDIRAANPQRTAEKHRQQTVTWQARNQSDKAWLQRRHRKRSKEIERYIVYSLREMTSGRRYE